MRTLAVKKYVPFSKKRCTSPATSVFSAYAADKKLEMPVNIGQS
jgi:hypothetical protein